MLTDATIRAAMPAPRPYKLYDGRGLFIIINPNGSKWWRFKYRLNGKEKLLSLGIYGDVSLAAARDKRDSTRKLVAAGVDPSQERQETKRAALVDERYLFTTVASEWLEIHKHKVSSDTIKTIDHRLNNHVLPALGQDDVRRLTTPRVLEVIRGIEAQGLTSVSMVVKGDISKILCFAAATGRECRDVTIELKGATVTHKVIHRAAITEPAALVAVLGDISNYGGSFYARAAVRLLPKTLCRPGIVTQMRWEDVDLAAALWRVPAELMKMRKPLVVPLSRQSMQILTEVRTYTGSNTTPYVFPNRDDDTKPMNRNTLNKALQAMGYEDEQSPHGFRATARTILDEVLGFRSEWIEMQLAHAVKGPNGEAYPRMKFIEQRIGMMQAWSDYLDKLQTAG